MSDRLVFAQSNQLFPFSESDTQNLLRCIDPDISENEFKQIYSLTKGIAAKIDYVVKKFRLEQSWAKILDYDHTKDLYEDDLRRVIDSDNINTKNNGSLDRPILRKISQYIVETSILPTCLKRSE